LPWIVFAACRKVAQQRAWPHRQRKNYVLYQATTLRVAKKLLLHITPRLWSMQKTHALYQGTTLHIAKKLLLHITPRLWRIAEKLIGFASGHDFTGCKKTPASYNATTLEHAGKLKLCIRARLYILQKNSCFI
jgi:hypothetical protein